jgi:Asp-tRNA(Asn)/Glu-tRNA(Gln) amidotransferase A subunit family amidase
VTDTAVLLDVIAGVDPQDPATLQAEGKVPETYTAFLDENGLQGARIGVVRKLFGPDTDPEAKKVNDLMNAAIAKMEELGAVIVDPVDPPYVELMNFTDMPYRGSFEMQVQFNQYLDSLGDAAPVASYAEIAEVGSPLPNIQTALDRNVLRTSLNDPEYLNVLWRGTAWSQAGILTAVDEHDLDALLYPTRQGPPAPIGMSGLPSNCVWSAVSGYPAITVPAGFTEEGLPVGLELLGLPWSEPTLLKFAYGYEQATHHRRPTELAP